MRLLHTFTIKREFPSLTAREKAALAYYVDTGWEVRVRITKVRKLIRLQYRRFDQFYRRYVWVNLNVWLLPSADIPRYLRRFNESAVDVRYE